MRKIEEHERKKYLITDYMLDGRLGKIAMITSFQKFDIKIFIDTDNKLVDGRSISQNVASLHILVHDVINFLYYEHWTEERKYFYVY